MKKECMKCGSGVGCSNVVGVLYRVQIMMKV